MKKENTFQLKGFVVWTICAFFFLYEFFLRIVIGTFQPQIMHDLGLNFFQFSLLSTTLFFITYGMMQLPVGYIVSSIGLKRAMFFGTFVCGIASLGFAYSYNYIFAMLFRVLMGFGASFGFVSLLISVREWMPHKYSGIFIGISQFFGTLGPMVAAGPLDTLAHSNIISWRFVFTFLSLFGFILSVFVLLYVESNQQKKGEYIIVRPPEKLITSLKNAFGRLQPWYIVLFAATSYFTIEYLSENEGRSFLELKGLSATWGSYMLSISWVGYAFGCPILGFISDYFCRRKAVMVGGAFLGLIALPVIVYSSSFYALLLAFFLLGITASSQSIAFATIAEQVKPHLVGLAYGFTNMAITLLSAIIAPIMGFLIDRARQGGSVTLHEYVSVFNILIVLIVIAFIFVTFLIKETYCKSKVNFTYLQPRP